jgi:glutamate synthase (NADPH/NADH) small chain
MSLADRDSFSHGLVPRQAAALFTELKPPLGDDQAVLEADRCLVCGGPDAPAPCAVACPALVDVPHFVDAVAHGDWESAADLIFRSNLLGASCARVCPTEELCEGACVLTRQGRRPIEIGRLQRYATDMALRNPWATFRTPAPATGKRVVVIGAGPAGLVCAGELAILGHQVRIYEARPDTGGLIRYAIAPYRLDEEPLDDEVRRILALGVELYVGRPVDSPEALKRIEAEADAVFLGVGMGKDVALPLRGDSLPGVWNSLDFIEAIKRKHLAELGRRVAVIGGGNTAIDVAREAVRLGAEDVRILYRRTEAEMPAFRFEIEGARADGVRFEWLTNPVAFAGEHRVTGVICQRMRLGEPDASGRARPVPQAGSEFVLPAETVIRAIGQEPRLEFLQSIPGLELKNGRPVINPATGQTTNPRYFAGGDVLNGGGTVVAAVRAAKIAALGIDAFIRAGGDVEAGEAVASQEVS